MCIKYITTFVYLTKHCTISWRWWITNTVTISSASSTCCWTRCPFAPCSPSTSFWICVPFEKWKQSYIWNHSTIWFMCYHHHPHLGPSPKEKMQNNFQPNLFTPNWKKHSFQFQTDFKPYIFLHKYVHTKRARVFVYVFGLHITEWIFQIFTLFWFVWIYDLLLMLL